MTELRDLKMATGRRRESRYPASIAARITQDTMERIEALADRDLVAVGIIVRRALEAGLPVIERGEDGSRQSGMEQARNWWQGLAAGERNAWQRRVAPLAGRDMIAAAWKQAQGL